MTSGRGFCGPTAAVLLVLAASTSRAQQDAVPAPVIALLAFETQPGVAEERVRGLESTVVAHLGARGLFSRVITPAELSVYVLPQMQQGLSSCTRATCVQEIAGQLGGDFALLGIRYIVSASVGQSGRLVLLSMRLLDLSTGEAVATLSHTRCGTADDALPLLAIPAADALLSNARLISPTDAAPLPAAGEGCADPSPTAPASPPATPPVVDQPPVEQAPAQRRESQSRRPFLGGGAVVLASSLTVAVAAALLAASGVGGFFALSSADVVGALPTPGLRRTPRFVALRVPPSALVVTGGVLALLAVGIAAAGAGLVAWGLM